MTFCNKNELRVGASYTPTDCHLSTLCQKSTNEKGFRMVIQFNLFVILGTAGCARWHWDSSTTTCTTMTDSASTEEATNFIAGHRSCTASSSTAGWITCSATNPYDGVVEEFQKHEVSSLLLGFSRIISAHSKTPRRGPLGK